MQIPPLSDQTMHDLLAQILSKAIKRKKTIASAESCTGGLIGALLTQIPGSSQAYAGGVSAYSNQTKVKLLGVKPEILENFGAVSSQVACSMAENIRMKLDASVGISVTGIAGPDGATASKPIGTVWLGLSTGKNTSGKLLNLQGTRDEIRYKAAFAALEEVYNVL